VPENRMRNKCPDFTAKEMRSPNSPELNMWITMSGKML